MTTQEIELLAQRVHPIYDHRAKQMTLNQLAYTGGREYVRKRLVKFPNETTIDFEGGTIWDGSRSAGRVDYTPWINYISPIVDTITDLVFMEEPARTGGDPMVLENIDGSDNSIDQVMMKVNDFITMFGYSWICVDAPAIEGEMSQQELIDNDIRPYAYAVSPMRVVDWSIGRRGIEWILEEDYDFISISPLTAPIKQKVRRLWEPGKLTTIRFIDTGDRRKKQQYAVEETTLSIQEVPWVLVGDIPETPILMDTLENLNAHVLSLESSNASIFFNAAFPREFITKSQLDFLYQQQLSKQTLAATNNGPMVYNEEAAMSQAFNIAIGSKRPLVLGDGDRPFTPSMPTGLDQVRVEIDACVKRLMEISGISLRKEGNAGESALAKIFDAITVRALIRSRGRILQTAERWMAYLMNQYDPSFERWQVEYRSDITLNEEVE